jgi:hypothetical protein
VIRLNGIGGVTLQTRIEITIRVFLLRTFVILSEAKNGASGAGDMDCQAAQGSGE